MIDDLRVCLNSEVADQIAYLENTPVRGIANLLKRKQCNLYQGSICSLKALGNMKTEFGDIGRLTPSATEGQKKFRVSEVVPILRANPDVDDRGLLKAIDTFIQKDRVGEIDYNVTIFNLENEYIIKDGDKRTIAFYENRKSSKYGDIEYPVYVVMCP